VSFTVAPTQPSPSLTNKRTCSSVSSSSSNHKPRRQGATDGRRLVGLLLPLVGVMAPSVPRLDRGRNHAALPPTKPYRSKPGGGLRTAELMASIIGPSTPAKPPTPSPSCKTEDGVVTSSASGSLELRGSTSCKHARAEEEHELQAHRSRGEVECRGGFASVRCH
jgi:hypothetical protein